MPDPELTYDAAIRFFAAHGNVSREPLRLKRDAPTASQLDAAIRVAISNGQPRDLAEAAKRAVIRATTTT